jgi:hypothetical protein
LSLTKQQTVRAAAKLTRSAMALVLAQALATAPVWAQVAQVRSLRLQVIGGEGALNNTKTGQASAPVVRVVDERDRPVAGAEVTFTLPALGPGGTFPNGERSLKTMSDATGRAEGAGLKANRLEGRFNIQVKARFQEKEASVVVGQSNSAAFTTGTRGTGKSLLYLAGAGASVAGIVLAAVARGGGGGGGGTPAGPVSTTLTVGAITVGGPR